MAATVRQRLDSFDALSDQALRDRGEELTREQYETFTGACAVSTANGRRRKAADEFPLGKRGYQRKLFREPGGRWKTGRHC